MDVKAGLRIAYSNQKLKSTADSAPSYNFLLCVSRDLVIVSDLFEAVDDAKRLLYQLISSKDFLLKENFCNTQKHNNSVVLNRPKEVAIFKKKCELSFCVQESWSHYSEELFVY